MEEGARKISGDGLTSFELNIFRFKEKAKLPKKASIATSR